MAPQAPSPSPCLHIYLTNHASTDREARQANAPFGPVASCTSAIYLPPLGVAIESRFYRHHELQMQIAQNSRPDISEDSSATRTFSRVGAVVAFTVKRAGDAGRATGGGAQGACTRRRDASHPWPSREDRREGSWEPSGSCVRVKALTAIAS